MRVWLLAAGVAWSLFALPAAAAPPGCAEAVAFYNGAAGKNGVPKVLDGWTVENAANFRFADGGEGARAEGVVTCAKDGSFEKFEFSLSWTGPAPLAQMAAAQIAVETMAQVASPGGSAPDFQSLTDMALGNAVMLHLSSQSEWRPTGNGYEAFASVSRTGEGESVTYGIRRAR